MQMHGKKNVVVATTGDAASRQGEFYEAISFAVECGTARRLYRRGQSLRHQHKYSKFNPFKLGIFNKSIGLVHVNGRHPDNVHEAASTAIAQCALRRRSHVDRM